MITSAISVVRPAAQAIPAGPGLIAGPPGKDAYQLALDQGFVGTRQAWLASLVGPSGGPGQKGDPGSRGDKGDQGNKGDAGPQPWQTPPAPWAASTTYTATAPASVVTYNGACYVCSTSHTSGASFDNSKFTLIAAAGVAPAASGSLVQRVGVSSTTVASTSTQASFTDNPPTTGNTTQIAGLNIAFTPKAAGNKIRVRVVLQASLHGVGGIVGALFQNGSSTAVAANYVTSAGADYNEQIEIVYEATAGGTSQMTFTVGVSGNNGFVTTINGNNQARLFGGTTASTIEIMEFAA